MVEIEKLREEAVACFNKTLDLMQEGETEKALESLERAEKIAQEIKDGVILFHTLKARGQLLQILGRFEEALEIYTFSLRMNEKFLVTYPENKLYLDTLQMNLNNIGHLGNLFQKDGKNELSQQAYEFGLEISKKRLGLEPENEFYQIYTGNTLNNFGELISKIGQKEKAKENYEEALKIYEKLLKKHPENTEYLSDISMALNNLGLLLSETGQKEEAKNKFQNSLDFLEDLTEKNPENKTLQKEITLIKEKLKTF
ncbi:MAG: tetratricopeptide repeat protein [Methanosarcina sp.]